MTSGTDTLTYLALGDSYTIGESVPEKDRFPVQTAKLLNDNGIPVAPPEIIAQTGWTSNELHAAVEAASVTKTYDIVTLLVGVNDQYRGRDVESYRNWFTLLLEKAIKFAGNQPGRVVVISIPDWGVTPFAEGHDRDHISAMIDKFNEANKAIAKQHKVRYLNITPETREISENPGLMAADGLHYSGKEMAIWAGKLADMLTPVLAPAAPEGEGKGKGKKGGNPNRYMP